jgi:bifunctional DNA-binding transcriptional regulator/antitoxin component of YhaV-PrlF toxin-antitoxin module
MQVNLEDVEFVTETSLTIRGTRRRTTVPKAIVDRFGLMDGDKIRWILFTDGTMLVTKVKRGGADARP